MEPTWLFLDNAIINLDATRAGVFCGCKVTIFLHEKRSLEAVIMRMYDHLKFGRKPASQLEQLVKDLVSLESAVFKRNV